MPPKKARKYSKKTVKDEVSREYQFLKGDLEVDEIEWENDSCSSPENENDFLELDDQMEIEFSIPRYCTTETQTDELYMNHLQLLQQKETTFEKMKHLLEGGSNPFVCLADELLMKIFSFLPISSVRKCVLVCRRWKNVGYDRSLWKLVNLDRTKITRDGLLGFVLHRGVQSLRLSRAEILAPICLNDCKYIEGESCPSFPVTHLDASDTKFTEDYLTNLLFKCESLRNLSLEGCKVGILEVTAISMNSNLEVLNLANVVGLTATAVDAITRRCSKSEIWSRSLTDSKTVRQASPLQYNHLSKLKIYGNLLSYEISLWDIKPSVSVLPCKLLRLRSLNLSWTNQTRDALRYSSRCKHLEELNVSGLRGGVDRKVMEIFVTSCSKLKALDFSDVTLQIGTLKLIADNCVHLQTLSISRCSDVKAEQLFELVNMEKLSHLNLFGFVNSDALTRFMDERPDIYVNKNTFSPIARPISTSNYQGRLWEQYVGFII